MELRMVGACPRRLVRAAGSRSGFTLAELTVALTVVGGVVFGLVFAIFAEMRGTRRAWDEVVALEFTLSEIDTMRALSRAEVLAFDGNPGPTAPPAGLLDAELRVSAVPRTDDPAALDVRVALRWQEVGGGERSLEIAAVIIPAEGR